MKLFRNHFSVVFSLFVLLCSLQFVVFVNKIIKGYENYLVDDYSVIISSNAAIDKEELIKYKPIIKSVEEIDTENVLTRVKDNIAYRHAQTLKESMPNFYTLKLERFPSSNIADSLKNDLLKYPSITRVEIFAKTYNKIYRMLNLLNFVVTVFAAFITIISLLLITKQMRIWTYEHQERMFVMNLFGASFFKKSAILYKMAITDSIIAASCTAAIFYLIDKISIAVGALAELDIYVPSFNILSEGGILLGIALVISIVSTTLAMMKVKQV
ncbi:MAG: ABC transporter permease [Campylobacteraceae bacterium]|jgi:cell division transport system permease protein|nr:ABC transporter permease [Campylobacteraceae bacterium]